MGIASTRMEREDESSPVAQRGDSASLRFKGGRKVTMTVKRSTVIASVVLFVALMQADPIFGSKGAEVIKYRVGGNVFVAAEETVSGALVAAGANVEILGNVKEGLKAFGGNVVLSGDVEGELAFAGANVVLSGKYHDQVKGAAANLILSGTFDGNVEVGGAKIMLTPTARIKGDLIYSAAVLDRQEGSQIMGKVAQKKMVVKREGIEKWGREGKKALFSLGILCWIISIPALIIVGVLINYFFPKQTDAIVASIFRSPWKNLEVGLVFLVVVPVGIVISLITLVGTPAGIMAGFLYGIILYISRIYIGVWIGRKFLGYIKSSLSIAFFWPLVVGTIVIALLTVIPFIGWLFRLFFVLISVGAMWVFMWKSLAVRS
jgi:cytoskeletal protein CcmA (bactofilin family)